MDDRPARHRELFLRHVQLTKTFEKEEISLWQGTFSMNRTLFSVALAAALTLSALAPRAANAGDGTITYNGVVTDTSCTVTGGGAASGTGNIKVQLPDVSATILSNAGLTAGRTPFSLILGGAHCTSGKTAALWVETSETTMLDFATGALRNTLGAGNVQVQLVNPANNGVVNLGANAVVANGATVVVASNQPAATIVGGAATLDYAAQYLSVGGGATPGAVETALTYSMQYN
jgi:major type 1 subunit fimbrin (pilin)